MKSRDDQLHYFFFQNSPKISESKKQTMIMSIAACETKPSLDWCNWAVSIDCMKLIVGGLFVA